MEEQVREEKQYHSLPPVTATSVRNLDWEERTRRMDTGPSIPAVLHDSLAAFLNLPRNPRPCALGQIDGGAGEGGEVVPQPAARDGHQHQRPGLGGEDRVDRHRAEYPRRVA